MKVVKLTIGGYAISTTWSRSSVGRALSRHGSRHLFESSRDHKIITNMTIIHVDMDDTICHFMDAYLAKRTDSIKYPQSQYGFFANLKPIKGAIESVNELRKRHDVYILTRPSHLNPLCYTEKRIWIEKHFDLDFCEKLIICPNKDLVRGDYLIDDMPWPNFLGRQLMFGSEKFPDWKSILNYFDIEL